MLLLDNEVEDYGFSIFCDNLKYITNLSVLNFDCIMILLLSNEIGINGISKLSKNLNYISNLSELYIECINK